MSEELIDFVIAWVDGSDPAWQSQKNLWLNRIGKDSAFIDAGDNRYRDWDNLRYWFRAVETYAPWVHKIHFVTCGQIPDWLNTHAPKLNLVNHRDFIPQQYLPTFSSHPIELNLHRIPGLSQQFVYFNDDFFLTKPVQPEDFFVKGLPCDSISEEPFEFDKEDIFNHILINNMIYVNRHFDRLSARKRHPWKWYNLRCPHESLKNLLMSRLRNQNFFGLAYSHLPQSFLKSTLEAVWESEPQLLDQTCSHRFRDQRDVNQYVFCYHQLLSGNFYPSSRRKSGSVFSGTWDPKQAAEVIEGRRCKMICINDSHITDFESAKNMVNSAFSRVLPNKSSFEL